MNRPLVPEDLHRDPRFSALARLSWDLRSKAAVATGLSRNAAEYLHAHLPDDLARRVYTKAAVGAGTTVDSSLGQGPISFGQWTDVAARASAFAYIAKDNGFSWQPPYSHVVYATGTPTAGIIVEGAAIPISKPTLAYVTLLPQKTADIFVYSTELMFRIDAPGQASLNRMLLGKVSAAYDAAFATKITTGLTPITSTAALADVRAAMLAVTSHDGERPFFIVSQDVAKLAATLSDAKGGNPFAGAGAAGGMLCGVPMLVSLGLASGTLVYLDAGQIAAYAEAPEVSASAETNLQMDSSPTMDSSVPTQTTTVPMYGTNSVAVKCLAVVCSQPIRAGAVSTVTGIDATKWAPV